MRHTVTATWRHRVRSALAIAVTTAGLLLGVQAVPAAAQPYCGHEVGGAILTKYEELRVRLGCPTGGEIPTPDGVGRRQVFQGGTIYWTPSTNAHAVWGGIGDKWAQHGWETGFLGYPVSDELANPDGSGKRQQFQGGTIYWHPTLSNGAHAVRGPIGGLWGDVGWEAGAFGYPTSDEQWDDELNQTYQTFSGKPGAKIWHTTDSAPDVYGCPEHGTCVGYRADSSPADWLKAVGVIIDQGSGILTTRAFPTDSGFDNADRDYDELWRQIWNTVPYPGTRLTDSEGSSLYKQAACHARYAYLGGVLGGPSWDLETDHPDVSWDHAMNPIFVFDHECNWY
jgi:hypothetical protein